MRLDDATVAKMAEEIYDELSRYYQRREHPAPDMGKPQSHQRPAFGSLMPSERIAYRNAVLRAANVLQENQEGADGS